MVYSFGFSQGSFGCQRPRDCQQGADAPLMSGVSELSGIRQQTRAMDRKFFSLLLALGLVLAGMPSAQAEDDDHELAQRALREGRALPLAEILAKVTIEIPGKLIDAELESEDGVLVYDLKMLTQEGRLQEIEVDAATGNILKVEDDD